MFRLLTAAALLAVPALPALAQPALNGTHVEASGATAGRSPHRAYRPIALTESCGRPAMHSVPAGKGHVFGSNAFAGAPCAAERIASAAGGSTTGRD
jgi:hypothetical protein